jgi:Na+-driven multidrug efflux pump
VITPERLRTILALALPIVGGMVSQNLLNLVDTAFVGRLGGAELGAVGIGGFATFMVITLVMGPAAGGVQAIVARRVGWSSMCRESCSRTPCRA